MRLTSLMKNCVRRGKAWRDAATLILTCQGAGALEYLMLERSKGSTFMPQSFCFPGGSVSEVDSSKEWIDLYRQEGTDLTRLSFLQPGARRPEIYESGTEGEAAFSKEISLRLTAIRETFEESGVLLCLPMSGKSKPKKDFLKSRTDIEEWQTRLRTNPDDFLKLCSQLHVLPDLGALYEWNNWLTPVTFKSAKHRFDTIFYIAMLPRMPSTTIDLHEVESFTWATPETLVKGHLTSNRHLPPPQLYEMMQMKDIRTLEALKELALRRKRFGLERWCPWLMRAEDGMVGVLPGDDLYPKDPDVHTYSDFQKLKKTLDEIATSSKLMHRYVSRTGRPPQQFINIPNRFGHVYSL